MKNIIAISILALMLGACSSGPFNKNINKGIDVDTVKLRGGSEVPSGSLIIQRMTHGYMELPLDIVKTCSSLSTKASMTPRS